MSVGHKTEPHESSKVELGHALQHPAVKAYLERPYRTDFTHHIPLTGGSNVSGTTYYGDKSLPRSFRPTVMVHERVEKALRSVLGMSYDHAHELATAAEKIAAEHEGLNWKSYKKEVAKPVRRDEKEPHTDMPADLDPGPGQAEAKDLRAK